MRGKITYEHAVKPQLLNTVYAFISLSIFRERMGGARVMTGHRADRVL